MSLLELQQAYNVLIAREKKAELFFADIKVTQAKKDSCVSAFNQITECLSLLMRKHVEITGHEMEISEVLNGFD